MDFAKDHVDQDQDSQQGGALQRGHRFPVHDRGAFAPQLDQDEPWRSIRDRNAAKTIEHCMFISLISNNCDHVLFGCLIDSIIIFDCSKLLLLCKCWFCFVMLFFKLK